MEGIIAAVLFDVGDRDGYECGDGKLQEPEEDVEGSAFGLADIYLHDN